MPHARLSAATLPLLLAGAACGGGGDADIDVAHDACRPLVLVPADDANAAEIAAIDDAIAMWNDLRAARLTRDLAIDAPALPVRFEDAAGNFFGVYLDETGEVVINRGLTDRRERAIVIAHELGHAFGLGHVGRGARASVMNPANRSTPPNAEDARALRARWPCGARP